MNAIEAQQARRLGMTWSTSKRRTRRIRLFVYLHFEETKAGEVWQCSVEWRLLYKGRNWIQAFAWHPRAVDASVLGLEWELKREFSVFREAIRRVMFGDDFRKRRALVVQMLGRTRRNGRSP